MAKVKNFEKVLEVLKAAAPNAVTKEEIEAKLGKDVVMGRISTYMWEIKNKAGVPVETVKDGRKVVAFMVPVASAKPAAKDAKIPQADKVAQDEPKAEKVAVAN